MADSQTLQLTRLTIEATREYARLFRCRGFGAPLRRRSGQGEAAAAMADHSSHVAVVFCSRPALRRWLGSRVLIVVEAVLEVSCGGFFAAHSTALLVELDRGSAPDPGRSRSGEDIKVRVPAIVRTACDWLAGQQLSASSQWHDESTRLHAAFWNARRHRDDCIHASLAQKREAPFQTGLFDRRAERVRMDEWSRDDEIRRVHNGKLIEAMSAPLTATTRHSALVLVPRR